MLVTPQINVSPIYAIPAILLGISQIMRAYALVLEARAKLEGVRRKAVADDRAHMIANDPGAAIPMVQRTGKPKALV